MFVKMKQKMNFVMRFGKFKGEPVSLLARGPERKYLIWLRDNAKTLTATERMIINTHLR
jgi:hypothetical protein